LYDSKYEHDACGVGFVANIDGTPTHTIVKNAIQVSINLEHRGAIGSDKLTGDGAGFLLQIRDDFFRQVCIELSLELAPPGKCRQAVQEIAETGNCTLLGWRNVSSNGNSRGELSRLTQPAIHQVFVTSDILEDADFEKIIPTDLVFLSIGFQHCEHGHLRY